MAIEKYIIDKSDLTALLKGEDLAIQPKGNIKGFCVEIAGNLTNGDMIKAMFPDIEFIETVYVCGIPYVRVRFNGMHEVKIFDLDWLNAPYKKEVEE
jgi:hypothetical protein